MKWRSRTRVGFLCVIMALTILPLFLTACPKEVNTIVLRRIVVNPRLQIRESEKMPVTAGIFIPESLKKQKFVIDQSGIGGVVNYQGEVVIGKNTILALYQIAASFFSKTVFLENFHAGQGVMDSDVQVVMVPRIDHFFARMPRTGISDFVVELKMTLELYDSRGRLLYVFTESGQNREMQMSSAFGQGHFRTVQSLSDKTFEYVLTKISQRIEQKKEEIVRFKADGGKERIDTISLKMSGEEGRE